MVVAVRAVARRSNSVSILKVKLTEYSDVVDLQYERKESRINPKLLA